MLVQPPLALALVLVDLVAGKAKKRPLDTWTPGHLNNLFGVNRTILVGGFWHQADLTIQPPRGRQVPENGEGTL